MFGGAVELRLPPTHSWARDGGPRQFVIPHPAPIASRPMETWAAADGSKHAATMLHVLYSNEKGDGAADLPRPDLIECDGRCRELNWVPETDD